MKQLFILSVLIILQMPVATKAQPFTYNWANNIGNNGAGAITINSSCTDNQNHYITVGKITGTVDVDPTPNYYFIHGNNAGSNYSAFIAEYDSSNVLIRAIAVSPLTAKTSFEAVAVDGNGNYIIAGFLTDSAYLEPNNPTSITQINGASGNDMFLAKYDPSMNLIWVKSFPTSYAITPQKIVIDQQNNIVLSGDFTNTIDIDPSNTVLNLASYSGGTTYSDAFLAKFDANGLLQWAKNLGTNVNDFVGDISVDGNSNIFIGVNYDGTVAFIDSSVIVNALGANFMCITKFNSIGQFVWNKAISNGGGSTNLDILDLEANASGEVFFTGKFNGNAYFQNPNLPLTSGTSSGCDYIAKLNVNGDCVMAYAAFTDVSVGYSLTIDAQSNIYLSGTFIGTKDFDYKTGVVNLNSNPSTSSNLYIASYDSTGTYRWAYRIATLGIPKIEISNSGKVWLSSNFNSTVDLDPGTAINSINTTNASEFITNYTSNGSYQWGFSIKGSGAIKEKVTAMDISNNGNVIVAGMFTGAIDLDPSNNNLIFTSSLDSNAYVASYTSNGTLNWANQIRGRAYIKSLACDAVGNFYVTGYFAGTTFFDSNNSPLVFHNLPGGVEDIFLIKYDSSGVLQWIHTFGSALIDKGKSISVDQNGNVIMAGIFKTLIDFDPSASGTFNLTTPQNITSSYVAKYAPNGNFIHAFKIVAEDLTSISTDNNNNIIANGTMYGFGNFNIAGGSAIVYTVGGSSDIDYYLAKYDSAGNYLWAFGLGNSSANYSGSDIVTDNAGNIYFTGYFGNYSDSVDINPGTAITLIPGNKGVLLKYSPTGNLLWGINSAIKRYCNIDVDNNGNPTIATEYYNNIDLDPGPGSVVLTATFPSCLLVRYSSVGQYLNAQLFTASANTYNIIPTAMEITDSNKVIIGGYFTGNIDFSLTPGNQNLILNSSLTNNPNGFLVSLNQPNYLAQVPPSAAFNSNSTNFCEGVCINFQDNSLYAPNNWNWSFPGANPTTSTNQNPQNICYPTAGTYNVQLIVSNPLGADTLVMNNYIIVDAIPQTNAGNDIDVCEGTSLQLNGAGAANYSWSPAATLVNPSTSNPVASPIITTTYILTGTNGSCSIADSVTITVNPNPSTPTITPVGGELQSTAANAYQWYFNGSAIPGATLQNIFPTQIGNYSVTVFNATGCFASSSSYLVTVVGMEATSNIASHFMIAPNPINDEIYVYSTQSQNNLDVSLYDISGKLIALKNMQFVEGINKLDFEISQLSAGIYRLAIDNKKDIYSLKVMKLID